MSRWAPSDLGARMKGKAYSNDLRSRLVAEVAAGTSRREAARMYRVSASSAVRWTERNDATGSVSPTLRGGRSRSPLEPHRAWLLDLNAKEPDLTLVEIAQRVLQALGLQTTEGSIRRFFKRHGISFKKKACTPPNRIGQTSLRRVSNGRPAKQALIPRSWSLSTRRGPIPRWCAAMGAVAEASG